MPFNIRVYGLLVHYGKVLVSDEKRFGKQFTKFPGGGLEFGEGIKDCLIREFQEELSISISVKELFYLTDFFQKSVFEENDQIISVYYFVSTNNTHEISVKTTPFDFLEKEQEVHRWVDIKNLHPSHFEFPIDKLVAEKLHLECRGKL
jgi:ADP-ribose pyrophosphatase YjhB (NUDIX family)